MEGMNGGLGLSCHTKCLLNNDVSKQNSVNSIFNRDNNSENNCVFNKNTALNSRSICSDSIECVQLDSSDSEDEPALKMARLSPRASPKGSGRTSPSLPSAPHSPLTRTSGVQNDYSVDCVEQNETDNCSKLPEEEDNLIKSEKCTNCMERVNRSEHITDTDLYNHSQSSKSIDCNQSNETIATNNINMKMKIENKANETFIKRLIGICVEKRLQTQAKQLNLENNLIETIERLKEESIDRNKRLNQIEIDRKKILTDFSDKQTQVEIVLNASYADTHTDRNVLTVKTDKTVVSFTNFPDKSSILKQHLMAQNDDKNHAHNDDHTKNNSNTPQLKNGLNKGLNIPNNFKQNTNKKSSDDFEVVTIDSDDDEPTQSHFTMKTTGLSMKSSHYNQALPQPKLSVSFSKSNNTNNSVINKGNNTSIEQVTLKWTIPKTNFVIKRYLIYMTRNSNTYSSPANGPIGVVDALDPPMACTLSNLSHGKYRFYVRAEDSQSQIGPSSNIECIDIS